MVNFPNIDPVAFNLGPLPVHWYGIAYIGGIVVGWFLLLSQSKNDNAWTSDNVADVVFYAAFGAVLGGRIGYTLFYNFPATLESPLTIFQIWRGGMSFHGGVLGFIVAMFLYARRSERHFFQVSDFVVPVVPIGLFLGRIANFVNQELWGAPTDVAWGVLFTVPHAGPLPRHPSQLYEAFLEGLVLFFILRLVASRSTSTGLVSAVFLLGYGLMRFAVEFVREPDQHIGYLAWGWLTMGQVLCLPMILGGVALALLARRGIFDNKA